MKYFLCTFFITMSCVLRTSRSHTHTHTRTQLFASPHPTHTAKLFNVLFFFLEGQWVTLAQKVKTYQLKGTFQHTVDFFI